MALLVAVVIGAAEALAVRRAGQVAARGVCAQVVAAGVGGRIAVTLAVAGKGGQLSGGGSIVRALGRRASRPRAPWVDAGARVSASGGLASRRRAAGARRRASIGAAEAAKADPRGAIAGLGCNRAGATCLLGDARPGGAGVAAIVARRAVGVCRAVDVAGGGAITDRVVGGGAGRVRNRRTSAVRAGLDILLDASGAALGLARARRIEAGTATGNARERAAGPAREAQ